MKQASTAVRKLLVENNERNVTQLIARSQIMISDAYALARLSQTEIKAVQAWSFWMIAAVILLSMAIAGIISYFLGRTINVSLRRLAEGTKLIAAGDLGYRLPVKGSDEIAQLSSAFNEMTANLARSREELQEAHDVL
jgi:nitrogen fixation/metabolism regulation signal transduction histidine kinase